MPLDLNDATRQRSRRTPALASLAVVTSRPAFNHDGSQYLVTATASNPAS